MTTTTERYTAEQIQLFIKYGESWIDNKSGEQIKDEILRQAATDATRLQSLEAENARLLKLVKDIVDADERDTRGGGAIQWVANVSRAIDIARNALKED